jgi:hypothetical protein
MPAESSFFGGELKRLIPLFAVAALATGLAQRAEYPGPTILSRGLGTVLQGGGELMRLRPFLSLTGVYEAGLTPVSVDSAGNIPDQAAYGGRAEFGVNGYHNWRYTLLGIDYRGDARHYNRRTYYDGSDHSLSLGVTHQISRQWAFTLRQAAGTSSSDYGGYSGYAFFEPSFANVPTNELFNARTNYLSSLGDLTYSPNARLSFNLGGNGMMVRRRNRALAGVTGYGARGDVQYRLGRSLSLGADYQYSHYDFTGSFGESDTHTVAVDLAIQLGRYWTLGLRGGGARVEALGLQRVAVDPIIAAILGPTNFLEVFYRVNYVPALSIDTGVSPGNGIYLTSRHQNAGIGYSYTAYRRWSFGLSGGYTKYGSVGQALGRYESYSAGGGVTCQVNGWMHVVGRYDARRQEVANSAFRRMAHGVSLGVAFSPGALPLSLW